MNAYAVVLLEDVDDLIEAMHTAKDICGRGERVDATVLIVSAVKPSVHAPYMSTDAWRTRKHRERHG